MSKKAPDPSDASAKTMKLENTDKRDTLIASEKKYQEQWAKEPYPELETPSISEFPIDTPIAKIHEKYPKYFGTMAFPYMNGTLHAGHSFTASKVEFGTSFARMTGKRVLFPLGFHCTGMPIKACADKLVDDVRQFGKNFENYKEDEPEALENGVAVAPVQGVKKEDITKFSSNKAKAAAKTIKAKYQFQIMLSLGIPREDIHKFADAAYWLEYFPPLCEQHLDSFGARIDWRRKFVTTDANPYFDAFVRWQMNRLKEMGKVLHGKRYTIYSPKDGQPCMDHDRTSGEGVGPTEYLALKLEVKEWSPQTQKAVEGKIPKTAKVFFVPATLRPETMYGQVCCFVGPKIPYGIFKVSETEYYVCTKRAAWNMSFQGTFFDSEHFPRDQRELQPVIELPGSAFVGTLVNAPLSIHTSGVRILPMETVSATKGTGIVTSVPSDSPDDYATMSDLAKKAQYYGIQKEWAELEMIPIIKVPSFTDKGDDVDLIAKYLVEKLKIQSPKDVDALKEAKDQAYKAGFYQGTMLIGEFKGEKVQEAKDKVRKTLIESGEAFPFADPSDPVISRSADECVVAYIGQWYLNYGPNDPTWMKAVRDYVISETGLKTYTEGPNDVTANAFISNIDWLNQWACARTYGLGSKLPWDQSQLVESLSDSTVYMAYYTISHLLHSDMFGNKPGPLNIKPEQMTDDVWDYVFARTTFSNKLVKESGIPKADLDTMRRHFEYWYPLDVRVSGKDLVLNHLTFFLYIHLALFPEQFWPRSIRINGHLLLNGEKMSKSTGNFLTLNEAVKKFGADPTRIALADAGDGIDDANFEEQSANSTIMKLYTLRVWLEQTLKEDDLRKDKGGLWDDLFEDEMHSLADQTKEHFEATNYKLALKSGFYDFMAARDFYREACISSGIPMSRPLIVKFATLQALMLTPIAPHFAEYVWHEIVGKGQPSIRIAQWPDVPAPRSEMKAQREYARMTSGNITSSEAQAAKKKAKGKDIGFDPKKPKRITIYVAKKFPAWQEEWVELTKAEWEGKTGSEKVEEKLAKLGKGPQRGQAQKFVQSLRAAAKSAESQDAAVKVFQRELDFDEVELLRKMEPGLKKSTGCKEVVIVSVGENKTGLPPVASSAVPGQPGISFENVA